jgi:xylulokinase
MFLGLDIGTSGVKAIIVDEQDREVASATTPLRVDRPQPLWSEQDPDAWWRATETVLDKLAASAPQAMHGVAAIGLSGQMLGVTLLDAADQPIRPALLWNDGRATAECHDLVARIPDLIDRVGCRPMPGFSAPKILWLSRHEPAAIERTRKILLTKDHVRLRLTGEAVSDLADASATLLMETQVGSWSAEIVHACGISTDVLPRVVESAAVGGALRRELAARWGLHPGLPICGGAGDNMCGAAGAGAVKAGDAYISLGTSGVYFVANDRFVPARGQGMHTHRHAIPGLFAQHGCVLSAAAALSWIMDLIGIDSAERFVADIAAARFAPGEIPVFSPYLSGERTPHDDASATATFSHLHAGMGPLHLGRAVLEGVAFAIADCHEALVNAGAPIERIRLIGGGARSRFWAQIIADVIGQALAIPAKAALGPALGAARLARRAVGGELIPACQSEADEIVITPDPAGRSALAPRRAIHLLHYRAFGNEMHG